MSDDPSPKRRFRAAPFGVAVYELESETERDATYLHRGIASSIEEAVRWCGGDDSVRLITVYPRRQAAQARE